MRKLRTNKGWTQNQLALKLQLFGWDTSRESVTRLENQSRRVPDLELFVVARILGVKADDLFPQISLIRLRSAVGERKLWSGDGETAGTESARNAAAEPQTEGCRCCGQQHCRS